MRNQILLVKPLPSVNKVYSMVLRIEKQRELHNTNIDELNVVSIVKGLKEFGVEKCNLRKISFIITAIKIVIPKKPILNLMDTWLV